MTTLPDFLDYDKDLQVYYTGLPNYKRFENYIIFLFPFFY